MRPLLTVLLTLLIAAPAAARPGDLDRSFGDRGRAAFEPEAGGYVSGLALMNARHPLLGVGTWYYGNAGPKLLQLTAGGRVASQTAFPAPATGAPRFSGGYALTRTGAAPTRYLLSRIGQTTGVTLTLPAAIDGRSLDFEAGDFGVDGKGRAVLIVAFRERTVALRYLPDGTPDAAYGSGGIAALGNLQAFRSLVRRDGRVYALTSLDRGGTHVFALAADGRRLSGFASRTLRTGRFRRLAEPQAIVAGPGGRLFVAGGSVYDSGWVARLRADGRSDRRFGDRGLRLLRRFTPHALVRDRRGRLVLAGLRQGGVYGQAGVTRLSARGKPDRRFGTVAKQLGSLRDVTLIASEARHVAIDDRGRIVIAGETYDDDYAIRDDLGRSYPAIARLKG